MAFKKETPKTETSKAPSDWLVKGWVNPTKTGSFTVKDTENNLLGFITKQNLEKLVAGTVKGIPISIHKDFKDE